MRRPVIVLLGMLSFAGFGLPAAAQAVPARSADSFVDSVGVNVRLGYTDTTYRHYDRVESALTRLGVRHIRDGLNQGQPQVYAKWRELAARGITLDLIVGDPLRRWGSASLDEQLALIRRERLAPAITTLEGPNELDKEGLAGWAPTVRSYQERLYRAVKADPQLRALPVIGPSLAGGEGSQRALGDLSRFMDFGNIHPYPGGRAPEEPAGGDRALAAASAGSKPVLATETGYHNSTANPGGHPGVSEAAAARYLPRLLLGSFARGVSRSYVHELVDLGTDRSNMDQNFGLLRNDWTPKPAFGAIQRLNAVLSDPGPAFTPRPLAYRLRAPHAAGVHQVLLAKRDGTHVLALWSARAQRVQVRLAKRPSRALVHRPSAGGGASRARVSGATVALRTSASVTLLELGPAQ